MARETILVLDPEPVVSSVIRTILEREGYRVSVANTLEHALRVVNGRAPDLLLTNIYIPGTTGHDAAKLIKDKCPEMRILMVTGLPDDNLIHRRANESDYEWFPKPFRSDELAAKVRQILDAPAPSRQ